ncbi:MAG: SUMF1/EgtB/PvdO family nonheme iron enzyme [Phycisphaera sp.]|nr:SUMF1/EgtB/PvdO family nonheme iron enzyme [Phycisphaera sp.]
MRQAADITPIAPRMIAVPGGTFMMGDANGRGDEQPVHEVRIDAFEIAECPVTVREYKLFVDATNHPTPSGWGDALFMVDDCPVCGPSWHDAVAYAAWLNAHRESGDERVYHLPTEAQREYAARGGAAGQAYPWGDEPLPLEGVYERGLSGPITGRPMPVCSDGGAGRNAFGLWHIADNVHEWCADWYDRGYYAVSPRDNPRGPLTPTDRRAARGGSWRHDIKYCRNAARSSLAPDKRFTDFGFRLARSVGFEYVS